VTQLRASPNYDQTDSLSLCRISIGNRIALAPLDTGPYPFIDGQEYERVLQEALSTQLKDAPTADRKPGLHQDGLETVVARLQEQYRQRQILPWSNGLPTTVRREQGPRDGNLAARNDYISVDCAIFPLWRTARVTISSAIPLRSCC